MIDEDRLGESKEKGDTMESLHISRHLLFVVNPYSSFLVNKIDLDMT